MLPRTILTILTITSVAVQNSNGVQDGSCTKYGVVEGSAGPAELCEMVSAGPPEEEELIEGYTLLITTYKGHDTMRNTYKSWVASGFLYHPKLRQVVVHINKCTCNDTAVTNEIFSTAKVDVRIICSAKNRLHPFALLASVLEVRTRQILFTENDRPTMRRTNEFTSHYRNRVATVLDTALSVVESIATPYVIIHRMGMSQMDVDMYLKWKEERGVPPVELTRPHQHEGDITECWKTCVDISHGWAARPEEERVKRLATCRRIQHQIPTPSTRCMTYACREWLLWLSKNGTGGAGSASDTQYRELMCHMVWIRDPGPPEWFVAERLVRYDRDPFVSCTRSAHWVNAPTVFDTRWYITAVAGRMCSSTYQMIKSGLVYLPKKPHFGHYGRKMEQYLIKHLAGHPVCHTDGITEHIELEDYLTDAVLG
eukprot:TRINITY_DN3358_c0_g1_i1.p1 TRINITY_DN3358_c0_g1~~TRINITY_DN3358_c0_g1_i1.p1  ORF type:complete len:452 (+),score=105.60 TRINITY_DN3358_c0_g1_i1:80-1357(+)